MPSNWCLHAKILSDSNNQIISSNYYIFNLHKTSLTKKWLTLLNLI